MPNLSAQAQKLWISMKKSFILHPQSGTFGIQSTSKKYIAIQLTIENSTPKQKCKKPFYLLFIDICNSKPFLPKPKRSNIWRPWSMKSSIQDAWYRRVMGVVMANVHRGLDRFLNPGRALHLSVRGNFCPSWFEQGQLICRIPGG